MKVLLQDPEAEDTLACILCMGWLRERSYFFGMLPAGSSAGRDCRCTVGWRGQRKSTVALMRTVGCNFGGDAFVYRSVTLRYHIAVKCL